MCRCFCNCKVLHSRLWCVFVYVFLILIVLAAGLVIAFWPEISGEFQKKSWTCVYSSCKICEDLEEPSIHLNNTMCASITYLSDHEDFLYVVSTNQSTIVNETFTDLSVPPACFNVDADAKACILLYDMNTSGSSLHICARIQTTRKLNLIKKYELGCVDVYANKGKNKTLNSIDHLVVAV